MRPGDCAEMAFIEFVDFAPKVVKEVDIKEAAKAKRRTALRGVRKKKHLRKLFRKKKQDGFCASLKSIFARGELKDCGAGKSAPFC